MKKELIAIVFLLMSTVVVSQRNINIRVGDTINYTLKDKITEKRTSQKYAIVKSSIDYKGKLLYNADMYKLDTISDLYYKLETFNTHYFESITRIGKHTIYWKEGEKSAEGMMKKGRRIGLWKNWYKNGEKMSQWMYFEQKKLLKKKYKPAQLINFWNRKGEQTVKDGTGEYFYITEKGAEHRGKIVAYKKQGLWMGFRKNGERMYKEVYKNGKLKNGESWDKYGNRYTYKEVFVNTSLSGGMKRLQKMIVKNFMIPKYALENGIQGLMLVQFTVNKEGHIENIEVRKKLCKPCDREAIRMVKLLKKWKPAKSRGQNVNVKYTLPLRIQF
jgi:TonB family protein